MTINDLDAGAAALSSFDWETARLCFERAIDADDTPEARDGLGIALWWLNEIAEAHEQRTRAYNGFRLRGETGRAVRIACWLAREQVFYSGNASAMQGWFARAERLLTNLADDPLARAWYDLLRASMIAQPYILDTTAAAAYSAAQDAAASDLEALALAFGGLARVTLGRVAEGMADLDTAMTMTRAGEVADHMVVSEIFCVMLSACEVAGDLVRSEHWSLVAAAYAARHHCPFLSAYCRTAYGGFLAAVGRWQEAETALTDALRLFEAGHRGLRMHAVIRLADLRVSQGRYEEAEVLLAGLEDSSAALIPLARLHLAKGDADLARAAVEKALDGVETHLGGLNALLLRVEICLTQGDADAARESAALIDGLAERSASPLLLAQAALAHGRVGMQCGAISEAQGQFQAALTHLREVEGSYLAGQVRLNMAQALRSQDVHGAIIWVRAAHATFERIGAAHEAAGAARLLRELGVGASALPRTGGILTQREGEIMMLIGAGLTNREIGDRLVISAKTVEHHVSHILSKLNLRSRAEVAAYAARGEDSKK